MRVAMLGSFPLDPDQIPGGVEAVIANLVVPLGQTPELELHLVTCVRGLRKPVTRDFHGTTVHYLPGQNRLGHVTQHYLEQRRIRAALAKIRPDLVHAHGTGGYVAAAQTFGGPLVATVHGIRFREVVLFGGPVGYLRRISSIRLEKQVLARLRDIFVIADYVQEAVTPLTRARFHPIANPVDPRFFDLSVSDADHTVLSVAAVQPRKGLIHLVEAMATVREAVPTARLKLVGKLLIPEYAEEVRHRITELGLDDAVEMCGLVSTTELQDAFTTCSVFTLCSVEESSPVAIAEAMALGKPVVATAVGGVPDLVADRKTGYLVEFGDVPAIAKALVALLEDRERRRTFGAAARARAERDFHPDPIAARTVAVYRQVLAARRETP